MNASKSLKSTQINRRLIQLKAAADNSHVREGWIHHLRSALNLTLAKLSKRVGVTPAAIAQAERNEIAGKITLETLKKIAEAMDCELIYAIVPKGKAKTIEEVMEAVALKKAKALLLSVDVHMTLEDQSVNSDFNDRVSALAHSLIEKGDIW